MDERLAGNDRRNAEETSFPTVMQTCVHSVPFLFTLTGSACFDSVCYSQKKLKEQLVMTCES